MRHRKSGIKLNRTASHRKAMFRNMVTSLFKHERIQTTDAKAKELRGWADHLITLAKRGDLHARRQALSIIREKNVVHKLFEEAPKRFGQISGGYTRVVKLGLRKGDAAAMSLVELLTPEKKAPSKSKKKKKPAVKPAAAKPAPSPAPAEEPAAPEEKADSAAVDEAAEEPEAQADSDAEVQAADDSVEEKTPENTEPVEEEKQEEKK